MLERKAEETINTRENQKKKYGWAFLFIGANIDAVEPAKYFGIDADRAVDYHADRKGTAVL